VAAIRFPVSACVTAMAPPESPSLSRRLMAGVLVPAAPVVDVAAHPLVAVRVVHSLAVVQLPVASHLVRVVAITSGLTHLRRSGMGFLSRRSVLPR
jgi:hypothetical protein